MIHLVAMLVANVTDCSQLKWCADLGGCFVNNRECLPIAIITRDLECLFTPRCENSGLCTMDAGRCVAASDTDCRRARVCTGLGEANEPAGRCVAQRGACVSKRELGNAVVELAPAVRSCGVSVCGKVVLSSGDRVPIGACVVELDCSDTHYEQRLLLKPNDRVFVDKQKATAHP